MKHLTISRFLKFGATGIGLLISGFLLAAVILSFLSTNPPNLVCVKDKEFYLASNGIHLDIIIPKQAVPKSIQQEILVSELTNFISLGFGDKDFYLQTPTWNDLKLNIALKALFLNSKTAIHLSKHSAKSENWIKIEICELQLKSLLSFLENSFKKDLKGRIIEIKNAGYTKNDKFYEGKGTFNCIQTCNNWVNKGLKAAQIKTSLWSPLDFGVLYHARKLNTPRSVMTH